MPSLFVVLLCKIKWQDSVAEKANVQRICFLPKGCWRLPILFPKKCKIVAVFHSAKNEVPTARGNEPRPCFEKIWQHGHEKQKMQRLDFFMKALTVVFKKKPKQTQNKTTNQQLAGVFKTFKLPMKRVKSSFFNQYFVLVLIQTTGSPKWGLGEVNQFYFEAFLFSPFQNEWGGP